MREIYWRLSSLHCSEMEAVLPSRNIYQTRRHHNQGDVLNPVLRPQFSTFPNPLESKPEFRIKLVIWVPRSPLLNFNDVSNAQTHETIPAGSEIALSGLTCDSNVSGCVMRLLKAELVGLAVFLTLANTCTCKKHLQSLGFFGRQSGTGTGFSQRSSAFSLSHSSNAYYSFCINLSSTCEISGR